MFGWKKKPSNGEKILEGIAAVCDEIQENTETLENDIRTAEESFKNMGVSIESAANTVKEFGASIAAGLSKLKTVLDERMFRVAFTYAECIKYFTAHANDNPQIVKGAILRRLALNGKTDEKCWEVTLLFLDRDSNPVCNANNVPLGFKTVRAELDNELKNAFKDNDLIIVQ